MSENPYPRGSPLWSARNTVDSLVMRSKEDEDRIRALESEKAALEARLKELEIAHIGLVQSNMDAEARVKEVEDEYAAGRLFFAQQRDEEFERAERAEAEVERAKRECEDAIRAETLTWKLRADKIEADEAVWHARAEYSEKIQADYKTRLAEAEADLAAAEGIIKDYELWCLDMGRIPIKRAAGRESGGLVDGNPGGSAASFALGHSTSATAAAAKPAARKPTHYDNGDPCFCDRDPDDEREFLGGRK